MSLFRLGVIKFGTMATRDGSKDRRPTRGLRHLKTTGISDLAVKHVIYRFGCNCDPR
jgi:hypothetical protein